MNRRLAAVALAAGLALVTTGTAHAAVTLSSGHADAIDVDWTGSALTLDVRDDTVVPGADRDPSTVTLNAVPASRTTVPSNSSYAFLGTPAHRCGSFRRARPAACCGRASTPRACRREYCRATRSP